MNHRLSPLRKQPHRAALLVGLQAIALGLAIAAGSGLAAAQDQAAPAARKVSLDFVQQDINVVAKALSIQSRTNVVLMPSVKGNVTVRLVDLSVDEALQKTAAAVGADLLRLDGTYYLGTTAELRALVARTGVKDSVPVQHVAATDAKELIQRAFPYLTVEAVGRSNILVLAGMPADVSAAARMLRGMDVPPPAAPKPEPRPEIVRDAYPIKYAKASSLRDMVGKAIPEVKVSELDGALVVEGTKEQQAQVAKLIAAVDVQGAGERVVRAYQLKYLHPHQAAFTLKPFFPNLTIQAGFEPYSPPPAVFQPLSVESQKAFASAATGGNSTGGTSTSQGNSAGTGGGIGSAQDLHGPGARSRFLLLAGPAADVEQATQVLAAADIAPQQVMIEARVVDVSPETLRQIGIQYNIADPSPTGGIHIGELDLKQFAPVFRAGPAFRDPFQILIQALERRTDAKILARPNISVIDGEEASIFIGDILRFERLESVTAVGQVFTIETVPVGIALLCRPRINDGKITLRVHPVVSRVTGFTGRNNDIPITASREADSTIIMDDGATIAIGGLLREEEIRTLSKVPLLGDLPFLGELFRHRRTSRARSEVTVFLTARIMKSER